MAHKLGYTTEKQKLKTNILVRTWKLGPHLCYRHYTGNIPSLPEKINHYITIWQNKGGEGRIKKKNMRSCGNPSINYGLLNSPDVIFLVLFSVTEAKLVHSPQEPQDKGQEKAPHSILHRLSLSSSLNVASQKAIHIHVAFSFPCDLFLSHMLNTTLWQTRGIYPHDMRLGLPHRALILFNSVEV